MTRQPRGTANEGIQANTVTADVIAVGRGAEAHKIVLAESDRKQLLQAVGTLHSEVDKLNLQTADRNELKQHASEIQNAVTAKESNPKQVEGALGRFVQKLKEVGIILKDVAELVAPLRTIAGLMHLPLVKLGLPI